MNRLITPNSVAIAGLFCASLFAPFTATAASDDDIQEMKRAIQELTKRNLELSRRLAVLEAERSGRKPAPAAAPAPAPTSAPRADAMPLPASVPPAGQQTQVQSSPRRLEKLEQRVSELEVAKTAQEDSVRSIIQDSLSKTGSKINEFVTFGGAIEVLGGRSSDFTGAKKDSIILNTAELDFEIRVNDWMLGALQLQYDNGTSLLFPTNTGFVTGVDRITVDRATVFVGDVQRFPLFLKAGRDVLPFGISTGNPRTDTLSIESPLTTQVFEVRANSVSIGFALPTPEAAPPPPPFVSPQVKPLVLAPLVGSLARYAGYIPRPFRPKAPTPTVFPPEPPPFYGSLSVYDGNTSETPNRRFGSSMSASLGYRTQGSCGVPYKDLTDSWICPWALDVSVDYISSVFDSQFLQQEYGTFLPQMGPVAGMAASARLNLGPFLLLGEWNGAIKRARFTDDAGRQVNIAPSTWQVSLGYQFDWNPWVETIGAQGTYVSLGYSRSQGLAGVTQLIGGTPTRVGFVPESRLILTAAEWVLEGARVLVEYSHNWDYPVSKGGTGRQADGIFVALTYVW